MQNDITMSYHYVSMSGRKTPKFKNLTIPGPGEDMGQLKLSYLLGTL